jgi:hypothetical protein
LPTRIDEVRDALGAQAVRTDSSIADLSTRTEKSLLAFHERIDRAVVWVIGLMVALTTAVACGMATGFLWLADKIGG